MKTRNLVVALGMVSSLAFWACSGEEGVDGVNGADGTSCYAKALKDSSGFELYCGDEYVGTLKNGEDGVKGNAGAPGENGKNGLNGDNGKNGTSCTVEPLASKDGYKVICAGDSIGVLVNGTNGTNGENGANGTNGENGLSAYEIAVANGFKGTEEEWIAALKGDKGDTGAPGENGKNGLNGENGKNGTSCTVEPLATKDGYKVICAGDSVGVLLNGINGTNGTNGTNGENGLSAYESAVANGFKGTEEEWLASLNGTNGTNGENGLSAYQIAVANGFEGSEEEWIASLKGAKGDTGASGENGLSAYEIAVANGFTGTEEEWIETLKGNPGVAGTSCSAEEVSDGVEITCTDGKTFTLRNGADGKDYNGTEGVLIDPRDKQIYRVVTIGKQTWMAENLNYKTENSWCGGGSDINEGDCSKYGRLYTWAAAVGKSEAQCHENECTLGAGKIRGVCPKGWHLPDNTEWNALFTAVGGEAKAGIMLKSTEGWNNNGNGSDKFEFSALPAGNRYNNGDFNNEGDRAYFWSSTENGSDYAYSMYLSYNYDNAYLGYYNKSNGYSVRCLRD